MRVSHARTDKYDAIPMSVRMSDYGYWVVTYSVSPGVYMSVMICQTGVTADQAHHLGSLTVSSQTGQRVTK
jgi:hypothetical protein